MAPTIASQVHSMGSNNSFSPKVWEMHIEPNWITIEQCKVGLQVSQTVFDHPGYKWVSTPGYDHFDGHNKDPFQWIFIKQRCASMVWIFDHELVEGKLSMCECQMFATGHISEFLNCQSITSVTVRRLITWASSWSMPPVLVHLCSPLTGPDFPSRLLSSEIL